MANLTLVYGMRLLPEGEVKEIQDATLKLVNGHEAHVTMPFWRARANRLRRSSSRAWMRFSIFIRSFRSSC